MMRSKLEKRETFSLNILYFEEKYSVKLTYSGILYQIKWFHENSKKNVTFCVSDAKFTLTWKKFRENNLYKNVDFTKVFAKRCWEYFHIAYISQMISRKFCQKKNGQKKKTHFSASRVPFTLGGFPCSRLFPSIWIWVFTKSVGDATNWP